MLTTDYIASGSGAPTGACPKRGKEYFDISVTPFDMYKCGADGGAWIGPFERYDDTKTGANYLRGLVSGGAGDIVVDAAGTPILYAKPVWNGIDDLTNKVLTDLGPFTCNTRATLSARLAGIVCHQQGWTTPATDGASATGTPSASFCLSTTGPCLKDAGGTLQAVTDAAGATPAPVLASSYTMPSGTPFKAFGMYQSPPPAGLPTFYFDASALLPQFNAADGTLAGTMVKPLADPGSSDHKVVRYIPGTGDPVRVQLGCADLSGVGTGCAGPLPLASSTTPLMDGAAAVGTGATFARPDHVHPSDTSRVPTTRTVNGHALSADVSVTTADLSLNNVTNDAQTKAAIVPNTAPAAGNLLVGNAGGTAYAPVSVSGSCTMDSAGVISCYKVWEC
jgi:hypothetical protein